MRPLGRFLVVFRKVKKRSLYWWSLMFFHVFYSLVFWNPRAILNWGLTSISLCIFLSVWPLSPAHLRRLRLFLVALRQDSRYDSSDQECIPKWSIAASEIQDCAQGMSLQSWAHSEHGLSEACSLHALKAQVQECSSMVQKETAVLSACFWELSGHWRSSTLYPFAPGGPF